jgi:hypothetical protein
MRGKNDLPGFCCCGGEAKPPKPCDATPPPPLENEPPEKLLAWVFVELKPEVAVFPNRAIRHKTRRIIIQLLYSMVIYRDNKQ